MRVGTTLPRLGSHQQAATWAYAELEASGELWQERAGTRIMQRFDSFCKREALIRLVRCTPSQVVQANLGKYLGEAAASIFSPTSNDSVPWGDSPFTGGVC